VGSLTGILIHAPLQSDFASSAAWARPPRSARRRTRMRLPSFRTASFFSVPALSDKLRGSRQTRRACIGDQDTRPGGAGKGRFVGAQYRAQLDAHERHEPDPVSPCGEVRRFVARCRKPTCALSRGGRPQDSGGHHRLVSATRRPPVGDSDILACPNDTMTCPVLAGGAFL
jgi:hypothetical protein